MKRLIVSNSTLRTLTTCSTKAWLTTNGWSVDQQEPAPLRAGRDAHVAFEAWLRGASPPDCIAAFAEVYRDYSDRYIVESDRFHFSNLSRILDVFFSTNPMIAMPFEFVAAEEQVVLPLGKMFDGDQLVEVCISDKSDGIVRMRDDRSLWAFENKTTGWLGDEVMSDYDLDSQITTHVVASQAHGWDVKGTLMQVVSFAKLPDPNELTPKTHKPASCRTSGHGLKRDCWPQHVRWCRFPIQRDDDDVVTWKENVLALLRKYLNILSLPLEAVSQEGLFGHCSKCDFRNFCKGHRREIDTRLVRREREPGIIYSGFTPT